MPKEDQNAYEAEQQRLIADAIADTQDEIFQSAFADGEPSEDDETEDTSLEDPDPLPSDVIADDEDDAEAGDDGEDDGEDPDQDPVDEARPEDADGDHRRGPRGRPDRDWRDRRVAESERDAARAEANELRARLEALERAQQQRRPQPQERDPQRREPPDLFVDPEGRLAYERQQVANAFAVDRFNSSMERTRRDVGDERFMQAFEALGQTQDRRLVNAISSSYDPGQALLDWHERQSLLAEIGDDPRGYRDRIREEVIAEMQAPPQRSGGYQNGGAGGPRYAYDLPPSLNSARGGATQRHAAGTGRSLGRSANLEGEIFRSAFDD